MATRDVRPDLDPKSSIPPQAISGVVIGAGIDLSGAEAALIVVNTGAAAAAATVKIQESADNLTFTDVADSDLNGIVGNSSGFTAPASAVHRISYVGSKQFIRAITTSGTAALIDVMVIRAHLRQPI